MRIYWDSTALAFFDQLPRKEQVKIKASLEYLAKQWANFDSHKLTKVPDMNDGEGHPYLLLRASPDLRVVLFRRNDEIVVVDIVRHSQLERLRRLRSGRS